MNEPDMQKRTIEVCISRDDDNRWWVSVIVDANDEEALWCGPYENQEAAKEEGLALGAEIDGLGDEDLGRFFAERRGRPIRH
jgi:hypothetical protein